MRIYLYKMDSGYTCFVVEREGRLPKLILRKKRILKNLENPQNTTLPKKTIKDSSSTSSNEGNNIKDNAVLCPTKEAKNHQNTTLPKKTIQDSSSTSSNEENKKIAVNKSSSSSKAVQRVLKRRRRDFYHNPSNAIFENHRTDEDKNFPPRKRPAALNWSVEPMLIPRNNAVKYKSSRVRDAQTTLK